MTLGTLPRVTAGRWTEMSLVEQRANIGSEVVRACQAKEAGNSERLEFALVRCLDLFDLTLADLRWVGRRREIARVREIVLDLVVGDNDSGSTTEWIDRYFLEYAVAARNRSTKSPRS
jgi:hypothetical protein